MRTIQELYELIKQKKENATNDFKRQQLEQLKKGEEEQRVILPTLQMARLKGEIEAYTDVLILIESSGVLEDETRSK